VFVSSLLADETWIPPGGVVNFTVEIENTGLVDIELFGIITPDATLAGESGELLSGQSTSVLVPIVFDNAGEYPVELYVVGYNGGDSLTTHTNIITITVSADPKPTASPLPTPVPTVQPTEQATPEAVAVAQSEQAEPEVEAISNTPEKDGNTAQPKNNNTVLYIIIGALGVILLVIFIVIMRIIRKKENGDTN
jgi:hypothetical protein